MASINIQALVGRIFERYDRNNDGKIDLHGPDHASTYAELNEKTAVLRNVYTRDRFSNTKKWKSQDALVNLGSLFAAADKNGDGLATRQEIEDLVRGYDHNKNGRLDYIGAMNRFGEFMEFRADYQEKFTNKSAVPLSDPEHRDAGIHYFSEASDTFKYPSLFDPA